MSDAWSISDGYFDVDDEWHDTPEDTRDVLRKAMGDPVPGPPLWFVPAGRVEPLWNPCRVLLDDGREVPALHELPADLPIGYHDLVPVDGGPTTRLIVHPAACPAIPRAWGAAAQIYELWSERSWGVGDLGDLATVARALAAAGGTAILISPLHQPAPSWPQEDSPYYPSSRRAWNPLLIAMDSAPPAELRCRPDELIDRDAVWAAKRKVLAARHAAIPNAAIPNAAIPNEAIPNVAISNVAMWNALCDEYGADWRDWPGPWSRPDPDALTARLAGDDGFAGRAAFHEWCQGLVAEQLDDIAATGVGIIGDLAIGFAPGGADAWEYQDLLALDVRLGAPPDTFNTKGQEWGIPPLIPWRTRNALYQPFIETIRAALRGVQALRIDHVMGLFRQYWIPAGADPADGAYVEFPADELLAIVCIEATRAGAYVIGEDLGTVAVGVRERLAERNIASTKVLWFEDDPPATWPEECLATVTTHDLPTIAGVLAGTDGDDDFLARLVAATAGGTTPTEVIAEVHDSLLAAPSRLRLVTLDDLTASTERPNVPGTTDGPSWRRRLPVPVDRIEMPRR